MKKKIVLAIILFLVIILGFYFFQRSIKKESLPSLLNDFNMKLSSPAFKNNGIIPEKFTCDGEDVNPPLEISEIPENTESLALIMDDPDAPLGTWVHWVVWNISPKIKEISENSVPPGAIQGTTNFGRAVYGGPCPPADTHRYFFKLYALDSKLDISPGAEKSELEAAMAGHILAKTELIGLYNRQ